MTQWKADMKSAEGSVDKFASIIREKPVFRDVGCTPELNFSTGFAMTTRDDSLEVLEHRAMTQEELQRLPMELDESEKLGSPDGE